MIKPGKVKSRAAKSDIVNCKNKCIFCFIDQLPKGMRETLYCKDDDVRMSFLHGNYVTLTNLTPGDIARIIKLQIKRINVSIHTLNPKLREYMIGRGDKNSYRYLKILAKAGIKLNCQIVCCPGINDGRELSETIKGLIKLGRGVQSVSIVPVGLTKHRQGLTQLRPFDRELARKTIRQVEHYGAICHKMRGSTVFYCADELYMMAGIKLPSNEFYEEYPQLENGVGMMRLFITEFKKAASAGLKKLRCCSAGNIRLTGRNVTLITGTLAFPYLTKLLQDFIKNYDTIEDEQALFHTFEALSIMAVRNDFFGESITVSGLVTGSDIIAQLKDIKPGSLLLIPQNMLRHNDDVFLDDVTVSDISKALDVEVKVIKQNGAQLFKALKNSVLTEKNDA